MTVKILNFIYDRWTYEQLVLDCKWSPEQFHRWLSAAPVDLVLAN